VSRLLPIVCAAALAWWASRRLGPAAIEPVALVSIIATSLSFRLVFEENIFSYYFMAIAIMLVLLDATRGRLRLSTVAWLATEALCFDPIAWAFRYPHLLNLRHWIPVVVAVVALVFVVYELSLRRVRPWFLIWLAFIVFVFVRIPWEASTFPLVLPLWLWQTIIVSSALFLAVNPLTGLVRSRTEVLQ
jgi:hypothetical protein